MKKAFISILSILLFAVFVSAKDVVITGTVKSFATGDVIASAAVFAFGTDLANLTIPDNVDSFYTDLNGNFSKTIQVADNANVLIYGAQKEGYLIKSVPILYIVSPMPTEVNVGDILLKTIDDATDTLKVDGIVIDSATQDPVSNATVVLASGVIGDITIDTFTTDNAGVLNAKLPYIPSDNPMFNFIFFGVSKELYSSVSDTAAIGQNGSIDLGTIEIVKINTPITPLFASITKLAPTHFSVYSLQGKRIYSGPISTFGKLKRNKFSNQQFIIKYFKNENLIGTEKILNR